MQDAINAGVKAIWAEKPFTLSLAEADSVIDLANRKGAAVAVNCSRRYNVFFTEARRMVDEGELGEILQITAYTRCGLSHSGSHSIDAMRFLVNGDVDWVFGEMESDEKAAGDVDLMGNGYFAFDNGVRGFLRTTPTGLAQWEFDLIGAEGRVRSLAQGMETHLLPLGSRRPSRSGCAGAGAVPTAHQHSQHGLGRHRRPGPLHRDRNAAALLRRRRAQGAGDRDCNARVTPPRRAPRRPAPRRPFAPHLVVRNHP